MRFVLVREIFCGRSMRLIYSFSVDPGGQRDSAANAANHAIHRSAAWRVYKWKPHWPHSVIAAVCPLKHQSR